MPSARRAATRSANEERIKATARALLALGGAGGLSLREVAREMGQSSSALYRYFANRDELLTALIIDAYDDLGRATEEAESRVRRSDTAERWRVACLAVRRWALAHRHEYALIFGSPVPGYRAPEATVAAASRVPWVMATIVADRYRTRPVATTSDSSLASVLEWDAVAQVMPGVPRQVAARAVYVWTEVFGFLSFELFGHLVGSVKDADAAFSRLVSETASYLGLAD